MIDVLFVEDDDVVREIFALGLRKAGFVVSEERFAEAALRSLDRCAPDLLLLDIGMPPGEMSGLELLARLRESDRWRHLPVIVLSGLGNHINLDIMARLGVSAVLTKAEVTGLDVARRIEEVLMS
jgi:CheY-like chemotaxis protein